jgi:tetratricopeptide (TPR) repeat protein
LLLAAFIGGAGLFAVRSLKPVPPEQLLAEGRERFAAGDFMSAENLAVQVLHRDPLEPDVRNAALLLAAQSASGRGDHLAAVEYSAQAADDESDIVTELQCLAGEILYEHLHQVGAAESRFRGVLQTQPDHVRANLGLSKVLALQTRNAESTPVELRLIRAGRLDRNRLLNLATGDLSYVDDQALSAYRAAEPQSPGLLLAAAQSARLQNQHDAARDYLLQAVEFDPEFIPAQAMLGTLLLELGADDEALRWGAKVEPLPNARLHPGIWSAWATLHARLGQNEAAARCFWEAFRLDAGSVEANYQLGQALHRLGRARDAAVLLERASLLEEYRRHITAAEWSGESVIERHRRAALLCHRLQLGWEEYGWAVLATAEPSGETAAWVHETIERLSLQLQTWPLSRFTGAALPVDPNGIERIPLPLWNANQPPPSPEERAGPLTENASELRFAEEAAARGLVFQYHNGADPAVRGLGRPFEFTGGGVGVIDYDRDGWPDVYLTQGAPHPEVSPPLAESDALFRNVGGTAFANVTLTGRLDEHRYSQGLAIGDYDGDGFPDAYIANIGANVLWRNNGDGTFVDVSAGLEPQDRQWTTSVLMADLTGDGLADLYDINYLSGPDVLSRRCRDQHGPLAPCTPQHFDGAPDVLWCNDGEGGFAQLPSAAAVLPYPGKGLGVVAADLTGAGRLTLFVANDGEANFLLHPVGEASQTSGEPLFEETAMISGVGLNRHGRPEACMGVVLEDLDGDQRLDLFVTNFADETNTLYRQEEGLFFTDVTPGSGMVQSSRPMLGFGAQAIDADFDGDLDLVVTNGHIDDDTRRGFQYEQRPQFFKNRGGAFAEISPESLGPYFQKRYLGRGLARLDWNRDGADDWIVTHLDAPAALVTNAVPERGHYLELRLIAAKGDRDAIGTEVTVTGGSQRQLRQVTAGDGYQASNERRLVFGTGASESVDVSIRWPSRARQEFRGLQTDSSWIVVEGRDRLWAMPAGATQPVTGTNRQSLDREARPAATGTAGPASLRH